MLLRYNNSVREYSHPHPLCPSSSIPITTSPRTASPLRLPSWPSDVFESVTPFSMPGAQFSCQLIYQLPIIGNDNWFVHFSQCRRVKHEKYLSFPSLPSNPRRISDTLSPRVVDPVKMQIGMQEICLWCEILYCKTSSQGMPSLLDLTLNSCMAGKYSLHKLEGRV